MSENATKRLIASRRRITSLGMLAAISVFFAAAAVWVNWRTGSAATAPQPPADVAMSNASSMLQFTFGLIDLGRLNWDGEIRLSEGKVVRLEAQLEPGEMVEGHRWKLRSKPPIPLVMHLERSSPARLFAYLQAPLTAKVEVITQQGIFSFVLGEIGSRKPHLFVGGQVGVERLPTPTRITTGETDNDFPALAVAPDGIAWMTYVAYTRGSRVPLDQVVMPDSLAAKVSAGRWDDFVPKGNGDQLMLMRLDGGRWSSPLPVTRTGLDLWKPALAVAGDGSVWVSWSQNDSGNWDVYRRRYSPASQTWDEPIRMSDSPGADINGACATDASGDVWWAWQSWQSDNFEIAISSAGKNRPGVVYLRAPGNQWNPAIAADSHGGVYVAWDSYERGNYDVLIQRVDHGGTGGPVPVADSPKFEANPSITCDSSGRVWIAYQESDENWGKDFGYFWEGKQGTSLYRSMRIRVRVLDRGNVLESKAAVDAQHVKTGKTGEARLRISFPRLVHERNGRLWLLYRRHASIDGEGEHWVSFATHYTGDAWSEEVRMGGSDNMLDNRPALAPLRDSGVLAVYSGDGRIGWAGEPGSKLDLYATVLRGAAEPKAAQLGPKSPVGPVVSPVHPNEAQDVARVRAFTLQAGRKRYQLFRGEFHRHTEISTHHDWMDGPLESMWRYGLDAASLDWIGCGDHVNGYQEHPWWITQKSSDIYHHPARFVPMFTYERSMDYPDGHRNVMFAQRGIYPLPSLGVESLNHSLFKVKGDPIQGTPDTKMLYAYLKHFSGICASHTSATYHGGTDWRDNDPGVEPVVEIYQGLRRSYEYPGAPKADPDRDQPPGYIWDALQKGFRLGFECSSDHASTHISYAVILAEKLTRESILQAFRERHSYGATDNIILVFQSGSHLMGDEFTASQPQELEITAVGTTPITQLDIIRGVGAAVPVFVYTSHPGTRELKLKWKDKELFPGNTVYYYARIQQADGNIAWASPMWIRYP